MSATVRTIITSYSSLQNRNKIDDVLIQKIDIDRAFEALSNDRTLTDLERQVISVASTGCSRNYGSRQLGMHRRKYLRILNSGCRKIAEFLGDEYSDERILRKIEVRLRRKLTKGERKLLIGTLMRFGGNYNKESVI